MSMGARDTSVSLTRRVLPVSKGVASDATGGPVSYTHLDVYKRQTYGSPEKLAELSARLDQLADEAGRDPGAIGRASSLSLSEPDADVRANIERLAEAGFGYLVCGWPSEGRNRVEAFARTVMVDYTD